MPLALLQCERTNSPPTDTNNMRTMPTATYRCYTDRLARLANATGITFTARNYDVQTHTVSPPEWCGASHTRTNTVRHIDRVYECQHYAGSLRHRQSISAPLAPDLCLSVSKPQPDRTIAEMTSYT